MNIFNIIFVITLFFVKNLNSGPWSSLLANISQPDSSLIQQPVIAVQPQQVPVVSSQSPEPVFAAVMSQQLVQPSSVASVPVASVPVDSVPTTSKPIVISPQIGSLLTQEEIEKIKQEAVAEYLKKQMDQLSGLQQPTQQTQPNPLVQPMQPVAQVPQAIQQVTAIPGMIPQ